MRFRFGASLAAANPIRTGRGFVLGVLAVSAAGLEGEEADAFSDSADLVPGTATGVVGVWGFAGGSFFFTTTPFKRLFTPFFACTGAFVVGLLTGDAVVDGAMGVEGPDNAFCVWTCLILQR